jgi:hypothetical protein
MYIFDTLVYVVSSFYKFAMISLHNLVTPQVVFVLLPAILHSASNNVVIMVSK